MRCISRSRKPVNWISGVQGATVIGDGGSIGIKSWSDGDGIIGGDQKI